ncbi:MAG TPA: HD domain-containing protein [bacterium]|jgi:putative nucleotidyltransferase with HDIG domain|nr:HD domain-containing protein [bacterium]HNT64273.1 HD domain-containing protein [bacterium]HOX85263.1 HD domain-containing protein [bacterium]HPG44422.1 HD domain-containing protein [bacterium]HPM96980.1 HD domain-containing protein [bacterium]
MQEELIARVPEFVSIKDQKMRQKAIACWLEAMAIGGWEIDDLEKIPFTLLIPNTRISFLAHTRAVTQVALRSAQVLQDFYAREYTIDWDALTAGALLHDIGKLLEYERVKGEVVKSESGKLLRHPFSGAGLAVKNELPDKVVHIVATHAKEGDSGYRCPEAVIVHHADFMNFEPLKSL